jgi:hypothetical protein
MNRAALLTATLALLLTACRESAAEILADLGSPK